jgi:hypothetical protein
MEVSTLTSPHLSADRLMDEENPYSLKWVATEFKDMQFPDGHGSEVCSRRSLPPVPALLFPSAAWQCRGVSSICSATAYRPCAASVVTQLQNRNLNKLMSKYKEWADHLYPA